MLDPEKFFDYIRSKPDRKGLDDLFIYSVYRTNRFIRKIILGDDTGDYVTTTTTILPTSSTTSTSTTTTTTTIGVNFYNDTDKLVQFSLTDIARTQQFPFSIDPTSSKISNFNVISNPTLNVNLISLSISNPNTNIEVNSFNGYELVIRFNNGLTTTLYSDEAQLSTFRGSANTSVRWFDNVSSVRIRYSSTGTTTSTSTTSTTSTSSSTTSTSTSSTTSSTSSSTSTTSSPSTTTTTIAPTSTSTTSSSTTTSTTTIGGITVNVVLENILHDNPSFGYQVFNNVNTMIDSGSLGNQSGYYTISNFTLPFKFKLSLSDTNLIVAQGNYTVKIYRTFNQIIGNLLSTTNLLVPYSQTVLTDLSNASDTRNITVVITQIDDVSPTTSTTTSSTTSTTTSTSSTTTTTTTIAPMVNVVFADTLNRGLTFNLTPGNYSITPGLSGSLNIPQDIYTVNITGDYSNTLLQLKNASGTVVSNNPTTSGFTINVADIRSVAINPVPTTTSTTTTSTTTTTTTLAPTGNINIMLEIVNNTNIPYEGYFSFQ